MNKKALLLAFMLLAIPIMTALPVYAGKAQEKSDFFLYMEGDAVAPPDKIWTTKCNLSNPALTNKF